MKLASRFVIAVKALHQLGLEQLGLYAIYRIGLSTGHYQRRLATSLNRLNDLNRVPYLNLHACLSGLPDRDAMLKLLGDQVGQLYEQADEIVAGKVRLFGGNPVPLVLKPAQPVADWTSYESKVNQVGDQDIKFLWEPGRFGWACILAMAYHLSDDERYSVTFWKNTEDFLSSNPPYLGPQWSSAQEVAIRLVALAFSLQVFSKPGQATSERLDNIAQAIALHAERIPPTLPYARSQNNNHLISEALGLYTASALLPQHPLAPKWHTLGWKWLLHSFRTQIDPDGTYIQHSTNYHRLMLQAALWAYAVHDGSFVNEPIPEDITKRLQTSTRWLWKLADPESGRVPNLGHNDGANILPLTVCPFHDYRPIIYAAAQAFLQEDVIPHGSWNDMGSWLCFSSKNHQNQVGFDQNRAKEIPQGMFQLPPQILEDQKSGSWISMRVARFHSRPAHADQLHIDLWWHGLNIAQDPGTYFYNAAPPWDNSLTSALVHNTVTVDGKEFMLRAGRFLYLDWAQAEVVGGSFKPGEFNLSLMAQHDGYRNIGMRHQRIVDKLENGHWRITDLLQGPTGAIHTTRLHWLLPDWDYEVQEYTGSTGYPLYDIRIRSPYGWVTLKLGLSETDVKPDQIKNSNVQLIRAGNLLYGSGSVSPISGWASPTYSEKNPALSCIFEITQPLPVGLRSEWILPDET
jgi:Heparinase II/III N-terminus/Heparinase II/III-like protein